MSGQPSVVTTVTVRYDRLDAGSIIHFAQTLTAQKVRESAPVEVKIHHGQRDQVEAVTMTATVVHG